MASQVIYPRQHIQDHAAATNVVYHWGYASRVVPCVNDKGSCEYLDAVYWMHDVSMLYTFIMWAVIGSLLGIFVFLRVIKPSSKQQPTLANGSEQQSPIAESSYYRAWRGTLAFFRRRLLPEGFAKIFGRVTRLQVLILGIICGYLTIFTLVGIVYKTWITPVKNLPAVYNTRTGIGGWADRVGALAYALTPLTVALGTRESILSLLTGIPYQSFNFLHRWTGRIIFVQSILHTIGWCVIEARLYQPQPKVWKNFIKQLYMIWGVVAFVLIFLLWALSTSWAIKKTGHEFFRKAHYVLAMVYIGACWGHWNQLACWMIASLGVWGLDRGLRFLRTILIHTRKIDGSTGLHFKPSQSTVEYFDDQDGGIVRLEFDQTFETWHTGQHFFLNFPALTVWQSHPFTTVSLPGPGPVPHHVYIARCRDGETARLKTLAQSTTAERESKMEAQAATLPTTPVILCGPYGPSLLSSRNPELTNILAIAGGTGVSLTLPLALTATSQPAFTISPNNPNPPVIDFVWIIRRAGNIRWVAQELEELKRRARSASVNLCIHILVTRESRCDSREPSLHEATSSSSDESEIASDEEKTAIEGNFRVEGTKRTTSSSLSSSFALRRGDNFKVTFMDDHHPTLSSVVGKFLEERADGRFRTRVVASGPRGMGTDLREAVGKSNDGAKVWKGEGRFDVSLEWDDRG